METISIASVQKGHELVYYDATKEQDLEKLVQAMIEKIQSGWILYGLDPKKEDGGGEFERLIGPEPNGKIDPDLVEAKMKKLKELLIAKEGDTIYYRNKKLAPPHKAG